jgi:transposase-like protein
MKTMKQQHYSAEFKEQAIAKVFGRSKDQSVESIADDLNMSKGTLRNWMKMSLRSQRASPVSAKPPSEWTPADRLLALQESHGLEEEALNAWCRGRGIFAHELTQWRSDFCEAAGSANRREESEELRQLRVTNLQLQRDLNRKDKALAEAAALLVLQKKYRALWAAEDA